MPKDLADLAATAKALPAELQAAQVAAVRKSGLLVTRSIRDQIRAATGGDSRLSGVGSRGARVGARFDVRGRVNPTARITAVGPLHLIDRDTSPHRITPRGRRVSKRWQRAAARGRVDPAKPIYLSGAKALRLGDGGFRGGVDHPGTHGQHVWAKGVNAARPQVRHIFDDEIHRAVVRAVR